MSAAARLKRHSVCCPAGLLLELSEYMHYLLFHSPLVSKQTWMLLVPSLKAAGFEASIVELENNTTKGEKLYEHHLAQVETALATLQGEKIVAVAHSGAGNLLALLNTDQIAAYIFLDAIFPLNETSRFAQFDDPAVARIWRKAANQNRGMIPAAMIARLGEQVEDDRTRKAFIAGIVDAPVELYEELIPVHSNWPPSKPGLFVQWTRSYSADAARAEQAGFEVHRERSSHFKMLNQPDEVAAQLAGFSHKLE